ncbi:MULTISPECIES: hypothetical protein [Nesterenkonia]|uniref:Uncharacterized protein n=1 Tax=Nesterenkonia cremea TaxID=1882340 RepID=A0A917AV75_9MICC|nr:MULTISPECIES: hypothetical protein [Nesterenkonia]GGE78491.1 hypothetical protein GCM10011401_27170 [Nesterenkonia cremea]
MSFILPATTSKQEKSWGVVFDLQKRHPEGWTLIGGQMVHLHCAERGVFPTRSTDDADAVLDVRSRPNIHFELTTVLKEFGMRIDRTSRNERQHRWINDEGAQVDVLIPTNLGDHASGKKGAGGSPTIQSPGGQQAINRSEVVEMTVGSRTGFVPRPNMLGALVSKAAAYTSTVDDRRERHIEDFAALASVMRRSDRVHEASSNDRRYLAKMLAGMAKRSALWGHVEGAEEGVDMIRSILENSTPPSRKKPLRPGEAGHSTA